MPTSCLKSNLSQVLRFLTQQRKFTICPTQLHWISLRVSTHLRIVQVLIVNTPWIISSFLRCSHSAWFSFCFIIYFLYQVWFLCLQVYLSIYITQWLSVIKELMQVSVLSNFTTLPLPPPQRHPMFSVTHSLLPSTWPVHTQRVVPDMVSKAWPDSWLPSTTSTPFLLVMHNNVLISRYNTV